MEAVCCKQMRGHPPTLAEGVWRALVGGKADRGEVGYLRPVPLGLRRARADACYGSDGSASNGRRCALSRLIADYLAIYVELNIREETSQAGLACLVDAIHAQPFTKIWGDGDTSLSDGQFFRAGGHGMCRDMRRGFLRISEPNCTRGLSSNGTENQHGSSWNLFQILR